VPERLRDRPYLVEFVRLMRETSLLTLPGVSLLPAS
jgi:LysR family transcriptional regulator for metE and metH